MESARLLKVNLRNPRASVMYSIDQVIKADSWGGELDSVMWGTGCMKLIATILEDYIP